MKHNKKDLDRMIEDAAQSIRNETIEESVISQSAARVWSQISRQMTVENSEGTDNALSAKLNFANTEALNAENADEHIGGCADFQSLMPDYLSGELSTARTLLLEDHTGECIPCRRALKAHRTGKTAAFIRQPNTRAKNSGRTNRGFGSSRFLNKPNFVRRSVAVAVVICVGLAGMFLYDRLDLSGRTLAATVESADGSLYVVSDTRESRPLTVGEQLQKGEHIRTAKGSGAVLRLADGSTVEMRERSGFSVSENRRGVTINLERGDVIVEAAKQHNGRLYVQTPDSRVAVKGTIFAVESGTKGSRVSVVEGEVEVNHAGKNEILLPGDQTITGRNLGKTTVPQTVAWSRHAARYANLVAELAKLRRDLNQQVVRPGVRYSSRFVDLVPEKTVFYAALPNLSETIAESERIMKERISQNPALAEWWKSNRESGLGPNEQTLARVRELGSYLGEEIVISAEPDAKGRPSGILVLGAVKNTGDFRAYLDNQIEGLGKESDLAPRLRIIDDPLRAQISPKVEQNTSKSTKNPVPKDELFVWIHDGIFAASPQIESLRGLAQRLNSPGTNRFVNSPFYERINEIYQDGAGIVIAIDLENLLARKVDAVEPDAESRGEGLLRLGTMNLRHFIAEQKEQNGKTLSRAGLTFIEPNRGIASWLAAPGSMGTLDFISPNANVATAFVVKKPELLVDDLFGFLETAAPDLRRQMKEIETRQGFSIRNDFAAPLGGEFAFAIDGPVLPTPSWKIVLEVYDQPKLQETIERAIEKLNQFSALNGKGKLTLETVTSGGRIFYAVKSADAGLEVHYTFANGYLIGAPSRALLEQSIKNRDAGNTLVRSSRFISSLPEDGNTNFSAIFYHDLAPLIEPLAERVKNAGGEELTEQQRQMLGSIDANTPPTLVYTYAEGDRITLGANTEGGAFGLSPASLIGLPHSFEMQEILMNALGDKNSEKR